MLRPVALTFLLLTSATAGAVETMRIAMGDVSGTAVRVSGAGLRLGGDSEEGEFLPLGEDEARVRRGATGLEVNGAPVEGDAVRFRATAAGQEEATASLRANGRDVRGDVVVRLSKGRLQLINVLPLEDYLAAVLGSEMPVSFPLEALKAQAVAARTYALQKKLEAYGSAFHLGSSVLHQVYRGLDREDARTRAAVAATRGQVLTHELAPIEAYFHASCGGRTESGAAALQRDLPYLKPVDCPCADLPASRWSAQLTRAEMESALRFSSSGLRTAGRTSTGRVRSVAAGPRSLDAAQLRQRVGYTRIKSLGFELESTAQGFRLSGRGYGHGAGLCQWGAKVLADRGQGYADILSHYYPGAELQQLY